MALLSSISGAGSLAGSGSLYINSSTALPTATVADIHILAGKTVTLSGALTVSGTVEVNGTLIGGSYLVSIAETPTIGAGGKFNVTNLEVTSGTVSLLGVPTTLASLKIDAGAIVSINNPTQTITTLTVDTGAQLTSSSAKLNVATLTLTGSGSTLVLPANITKVTTLNDNSTGTVALQAALTATTVNCNASTGFTGSFNITAGTLNLKTAGVTVDNNIASVGTLVVSNTGTCALAGNLTITKALTLTKGYLDIGSNRLAFGSAATSTAGSASSFIETTTGAGTITKAIAKGASFTFATGYTDGTTYTYQKVVYKAATAGTYKASYNSTNHWTVSPDTSALPLLAAFSFIPATRKAKRKVLAAAPERSGLQGDFSAMSRLGGGFAKHPSFKTGVDSLLDAFVA